MSGEAGTRPYCEDVVDRNLAKRSIPQLVTVQSYGRFPGSVSAMHRTEYPNSADKTDICMGSVTECSVNGRKVRHDNMANTSNERVESHLSRQSRNASTGFWAKKRGPQDVRSTDIGWYPTHKDERRRSLSRKPNVFDLRSTSRVGLFEDAAIVRKRLDPNLENSTRPSIKRWRLEKPLPATPLESRGHIYINRPASRNARQIDRDLSSRGHRNDVDLTRRPGLMRTENTTMYERWAPAVTHETITRKIHEICEQRLDKEIHVYHGYHRIQPIVDVEILPARHFVPVEGGYAEISEKDLPPGRPDAQWIISEVASKIETTSDGDVKLSVLSADCIGDAEADPKQGDLADHPQSMLTSRTYLPAVVGANMEDGQPSTLCLALNGLSHREHEFDEANERPATASSLPIRQNREVTRVTSAPKTTILENGSPSRVAQLGVSYNYEPHPETKRAPHGQRKVPL